MNIKIIGAGSIGNHLANAAITNGWDVTLCDIDDKALDRTKYEIYPSRYGEFANKIKLYNVKNVPKKGFDLIIIGTPPNSHMQLALEAVKEKPKAIMVEKPLCTPDLTFADQLMLESESYNIKVFSGYDHVVAKSTQKFVKTAKTFKNIQTLDVYFREHWEGIFKAHPWLSGPKDTYLGFWKKGGGALSEHSHALNLWQHVTYALGLGKVVEVQASLAYKKNKDINYDKIALLNLKTEKGFIGSVIQDVITKPQLKYMRLQAEDQAIDWTCDVNPYRDIINIYDRNKETLIFNKTRPDDFIEELNHINQVINKKIQSPICLENGLDTMLVIAAAHKSAICRKTVKINYNEGYNTKALNFV